MSVEIVVPQVGEAVSEVILTSWLKKEGDHVKQGEPLFELDTDKAVVEVEAFAEGTLVRILVPDSSAVMPQQVVGILETVGESLVVPPSEKSDSLETQDVSRQPATPVAQRMAKELGIDISTVKGTGPGGRVLVGDVKLVAAQQAYQPSTGEKVTPPERLAVSPKARRLAKELGIALEGLKGTGVDGLITTKDVEAAVKPPSDHKGEGIIPFSKLRRSVAQHMLASKQQVPHFYLSVDVDMTEAIKLRNYCLEILGWEKPPTYTDMIVRACAISIVKLPGVNVRYTDQGIEKRGSVDIGIAVALDDGLIVPVVQQADGLSLEQISVQVRGLAGRARSGRLRERDIIPKSMVVSNLGMYGVDAFVAIIDMPDPMILAVGQVAERVIALGGQPTVRPICTMTLSVDHRVLDGVQGSIFLVKVKNFLERPFELLR